MKSINNKTYKRLTKWEPKIKEIQGLNGKPKAIYITHALEELDL